MNKINSGNYCIQRRDDKAEPASIADLKID